MKGKGVSPVIATVILVAVAITVAVAVAYWMGGLYPQGDETVITTIDLDSFGTYTVTTTTYTVSTRKNTTVTEVLTLSKADLYLGDDGSGWLTMFNGTHMIYKRFNLVDEIIVGGN